MDGPIPGQPAKTAQSHEPQDHIKSSDFEGHNQGLRVPARVLVKDGKPNAAMVGPSMPGASTDNRLQVKRYELQIEDYDRKDPPRYKPGGVPRSPRFNKNVLSLTPEPCMPEVPVRCKVKGFTPAQTPISWKVEALHVLCRYYRRNNHPWGGKHAYYHPCTFRFEGTWTGTANRAEFTLFAKPSPGKACRRASDGKVETYEGVTYNPGWDPAHVLGGHAILRVEAEPEPGIVLCDFVHLRIAGANPEPQQAQAYLRTYLEVPQKRDHHVFDIVAAAVQMETRWRQFYPHGFGRIPRQLAKSSCGNTDPCRVQFRFPADPPDFPYAYFDYGLGMTQYTFDGSRNPKTPEVNKTWQELAWNWKANLAAGARLMLRKLRIAREGYKEKTWGDLALRAWSLFGGLTTRDTVEARRRSTVMPFGADVMKDRKVALPRDLDLSDPS